MVTSRRMAWTLLFVIAAGAVLATGAWAADNEPKIGVVDMSKVWVSPRIKQYDEELAAFGQLLDAKLKVRSQKMMLEETEIKELIELRTKANCTAQDTARIEQLEKLERDRDAELKQLQETKDATAEQKTRLKALQDMRQKSKDTGEALEKDYQEQYQNKRQELLTKASDEAEKAVKEVADAKALPIVLDKAMVLVGGIDITDDVVAKLDRKIE